MPKTKTITLKGIMERRDIWLNGKWLSPAKSLAVRTHSPDGFCWGYNGSGPSQLALAILLEITDKDIACENYQQFKFDIITKLPSTDFEQEIDVTAYCKSVFAAETQ